MSSSDSQEARAPNDKLLLASRQLLIQPLNLDGSGSSSSGGVNYEADEDGERGADGEDDENDEVFELPYPAAVFAHLELTTLSDLDAFLAALHEFWLHGGLEALTVARCGRLGALLFTQALAWLMLFVIDWRRLLSQCLSADCAVRDLIFQRSSREGLLGLVWALATALFQTGFVAAFVWQAYSAFATLRTAVEVKRFVVQGLQIPTDQALQALEWAEVLTLLVQSQPSTGTANPPLTAREITHCLLRCENFLVGLTERETLAKRLPAWLPPRILCCKHMLWNLRLALFVHVFDRNKSFNPAYADNPHVLALRLRLLGALNLIFLLPVLCCSVLLSAFERADSLRVRGAAAADAFKRREFNDFAHWSLRCYNETEYQVRRRLQGATDSMVAYLLLQPLWSRKGAKNVASSCLLQFLQFASSALLVILFVLALVDERPLIHVRLFHRPLLWYSLLLGGVLTVSRLLQSKGSRTIETTGRASLCNRLLLTSAVLHSKLICSPPAWRCLYTSSSSSQSSAELPISAANPLFVGPRHQRIQEEICRRLFRPVIAQVAEDLAALLLTPYVLGYVLAGVPRLQESLRARWVRTRRIGVVCADAWRSSGTEKQIRSRLLFQLNCRCWSPLGPPSEERRKLNCELEREIRELQRAALAENPSLEVLLPSEVQAPTDTEIGEAAISSTFFWLAELRQPCVVRSLLTMN